MLNSEDETRKQAGSPNSDRDLCLLHPPQFVITDTEGHLTQSCDCGGDSSNMTSRRPSAIIAALRRPSQTVALSAAHAVMNPRRYLLGMFSNSSSQNLRKEKPSKLEKISLKFANRPNNNGLTIILAALYAKLLVVLGIAFPMTEVISDQVHPYYYQRFYLYLYTGSTLFISCEYVSFVKERAVKETIKNFGDLVKGEFLTKHNPTIPAKKYGSFFLRLGAIAFGIGRMVYSGLELGRYFELRNMPECYSNALQAITPLTRMLLTLLQVQFIFLNHKMTDGLRLNGTKTAKTIYHQAGSGEKHVLFYPTSPNPSLGSEERRNWNQDISSNIAGHLQVTNNNSDQSITRMKKNDSDPTTQNRPSSEPNFHHQGLRLGIYGWRKKCLYALILMLLFIVIVNLALTLWVLKVLDFSSDGMGSLEVIPGGVRLKGNAYILENLVASRIKSRHGEPIVIESSRNITLTSRDHLGHSRTSLHLGLEEFQCTANQFEILDDRGRVIFSTDKNHVVVGADTLKVSGEGGTRFSGSVQTRLVRAESGHDLRLESPTRDLEIKAPKELKLESRGGNIQTLAQNDITFRSEIGAVRLESSSIIVPQLPTAKVTHRPIESRTFDVFQLCVCETGRLFLADPHVVCASENEDGLCR